MSNFMSHFQDMVQESGDSQEFFPGSRKPIIRHPNRTQEADHRPDPNAWDAKPQKHKVRGVMTDLFTVGSLAQALGRKPVTIRMWERKKIIPNATVQMPGRNGDLRGKRRLYTREQVEGLLRIATEEGLMNGDNRPIRNTEFTKRAFQLFRDLSA